MDGHLVVLVITSLYSHDQIQSVFDWPSQVPFCALTERKGDKGTPAPPALETKGGTK